ncbi:Beta-lactamase-like protein 2 [Coemansia sp. BCRC 34490]|nr:Beta-lactamase-like protein 2 [Coemansia sp. BCRC 34490]
MQENMSKLAPIERVSQSIVRVLGLNPGPFTLQGTNTYVVGQGERRTLVDTGDGAQPEYFERLKECLGGSRIDRILLTHWHADHIGGINQLLSMPDVVAPDCAVYKNSCPEVDGRDSVAAMLSGARARGCLRGIADGQVFDVDAGRVRMTAVYTPGHTDDHMGFVVQQNSPATAGEEEEERGVFLVTGDLVLGEGTTVVDDLSPYMRSLSRVLKLEPSMLLPGHGPVVRGSGTDGSKPSNAVRVIEGYIQHRLMRESQIVDVLGRPSPSPDSNGWRVEDITAAVYSSITDPRVIVAAQHNTLLHLRKLQTEGVVRSTKDGGSRADHKELWELIRK